MIRITVLFNNGVEKTFPNVTKCKRCGDLKHTEIYYEDLMGLEHHILITDEQISMMDRVEMD